MTYRSLTLILISSLAFACSKKESDGSAPTVAKSTEAKTEAKSTETEAETEAKAAPIKGDTTGLDLAISVPVGEVSVPQASLEAADEPQSLEEKKRELADDEYIIKEARALADGWLVRYAEEADAEVEVAIQRELGGEVFNCSGEAEAIDLAIKVCTAISVSGRSLSVPFKLPADDEAAISVAGITFSVGLADEDTPASAKAAYDKTGWRETGKLLSDETFEGGFAAAYEGANGGIKSQGMIYNAIVRQKIGGRDLVCKPWGSAKTAANALAVVKHCRTLRAL